MFGAERREIFLRDSFFWERESREERESEAEGNNRGRRGY